MYTYAFLGPVQNMKICLVLSFLLVVCSFLAAGKKAKHKPLIRYPFVSKLANFKCLRCLMKPAPQCISPCFPRSFNKRCTSCLVTSAFQCLDPCGKCRKFINKKEIFFFSVRANMNKKISKIVKEELVGVGGTCEARPNEKGDCEVTENKCDDDYYVASPSKIQLRPFCFCSCQSSVPSERQVAVKMNEK